MELLLSQKKKNQISEKHSFEQDVSKEFINKSEIKLNWLVYTLEFGSVFEMI